MSEFTYTKEKIATAESKEEILDAVDELDEKYMEDESIMSDDDWPELTKCIAIACERIKK